jgi:1-deoxy-D-xylulose-5-phosphate synthase
MEEKTLSVLERINNPEDLRTLRTAELPDLAEEVRQMVISTVSNTGGHLASSLGVVELTIALLCTFDLAKDKIIWDVGHQCYAYKILTGRRDLFHTIRQCSGLSGFPKMSECKYDCFGTGHASTSISAALGMAQARDLKKEDFKVIAVIGDGSLTGGMAFEALNHAGHTRTNMIVILNDNELSISPTIGGFSQQIDHLRTNPAYNRFRSDIAEVITMFGKRATKLAKKLEESAKILLVDGMMFESLGFRYFGPIDGHNIMNLIRIFQRTKDINGPLIIHVITKKGKGYEFAEKDPTRFHSASSFDVATGKKIEKSINITYTKALSQAMVRLASEDKRIIAITAAMLDGTGINEFENKFPERCFDVGIAEQHAVTFSAGLASQGMKPIFAVYSTFLQRGYDQVLHDVCLQNLPVIFALDRAGIVGADGPTHHGTYDFAYMRHIPNMVVMAPKDEAELQHMLKTAVDWNGPVSLRYPRGEGIGVPLPDELVSIPIGKAELLKDGTDVLLLPIGSMVYPAINAAEMLERDGISAAVVNARFVKPIDTELILPLITHIGKVITIEEHALACGFGSAVLEMLSESGFSANIKHIGIPDQFVEYGDRNMLLSKYGLTSEGIVKSVLEMLGYDEKVLSEKQMVGSTAL